MVLLYICQQKLQNLVLFSGFATFANSDNLKICDVATETKMFSLWWRSLLGCKPCRKIKSLHLLYNDRQENSKKKSEKTILSNQ